MVVLINNQIDQLGKATAGAGNFQFIQKIVDPLQDLQDRAQQFYRRVRPERLFRFFRDSEKAVQETTRQDTLKNQERTLELLASLGKREQGRDERTLGDMLELLKRLVGTAEGSGKDLDFSFDIQERVGTLLTDKFGEFEGSMDDLFNDLIKGRLDEDMKGKLHEIMEELIPELMEDLGEEFEEWMETREEEWDDFAESATDAFDDISDAGRQTSNDLRGFFGRAADSAKEKWAAVIAATEMQDIRQTLRETMDEEVIGLRDLETRIQGKLQIYWQAVGEEDTYVAFRRRYRDEFFGFLAEGEGLRRHMLYDEVDFLEAMSTVLDQGFRGPEEDLFAVTIQMMRLQKAYEEFGEVSEEKMIGVMTRYDEGIAMTEMYSDRIMALSHYTKGLWDVKGIGMEQFGEFAPILFEFYKDSESATKALENLAVVVGVVDASFGDAAGTMDFFREVIVADDMALHELSKTWDGLFQHIDFTTRELQDILREGDLDVGLEKLLEAIQASYDAYEDKDQWKTMMKAMGVDYNFLKSFLAMATEGTDVVGETIENLDEARDIMIDVEDTTDSWLDYGKRLGGFWDRVNSVLRTFVRTVPGLEKVSDALAEWEISFIDIARGIARVTAYLSIIFPDTMKALGKGLLKRLLTAGGFLFGGKGLLTAGKFLVKGLLTVVGLLGKGLLTLGGLLFGGKGLLAAGKFLGKGLLKVGGLLFGGKAIAAGAIAAGIATAVLAVSDIDGPDWLKDIFTGEFWEREWEQFKRDWSSFWEDPFGAILPDFLQEPWENFKLSWNEFWDNAFDLIDLPDWMTKEYWEDLLPGWLVELIPGLGDEGKDKLPIDTMSGAADELDKLPIDTMSGAADELDKLPIDTMSGAADELDERTLGTGGGFILRTLPGLQHGGIVDRPQIAGIAEVEPEAVIPLTKVPTIFADTLMGDTGLHRRLFPDMEPPGSLGEVWDRIVEGGEIAKDFIVDDLWGWVTGSTRRQEQRTDHLRSLMEDKHEREMKAMERYYDEDIRLKQDLDYYKSIERPTDPHWVQSQIEGIKDKLVEIEGRRDKDVVDLIVGAGGRTLQESFLDSIIEKHLMPGMFSDLRRDKMLKDDKDFIEKSVDEAMKEPGLLSKVWDGIVGLYEDINLEDVPVIGTAIDRLSGVGDVDSESYRPEVHVISDNQDVVDSLDNNTQKLTKRVDRLIQLLEEKGERKSTLRKPRRSDLFGDVVKFR